MWPTVKGWFGWKFDGTGSKEVVLTVWSQVACAQVTVELPGYLYTNNSCWRVLNTYFFYLSALRVVSLDSQNFLQCFSAVLSLFLHKICRKCGRTTCFLWYHCGKFRPAGKHISVVSLGRACLKEKYLLIKVSFYQRWYHCSKLSTMGKHSMQWWV